jgi:hypothetical protein
MTRPNLRRAAERLIGGGGSDDPTRSPRHQTPVFVGFLGGGGISLATTSLLTTPSRDPPPRDGGGRELMASPSIGMA